MLKPEQLHTLSEEHPLVWLKEYVGLYKKAKAKGRSGDAEQEDLNILFYEGVRRERIKNRQAGLM